MNPNMAIASAVSSPPMGARMICTLSQVSLCLPASRCLVSSVIGWDSLPPHGELAVLFLDDEVVARGLLVREHLEDGGLLAEVNRERVFPFSFYHHLV